MRLCWVAISSILAVWLASAAPEPHASQSPASDTVDAWARENYTRALELGLPNRCAEPDLLNGERTSHTKWMSCVRIVPAFKNEIEYSLSVEKRYDGTLFAYVARPKGQSIYAQLCEHKKEHPKASVNELTKLIETESRSGDQRRFPALANLANDFEKLQLSPVVSDEIMLDATEYRFQIRSFSGEHMEAVMIGPGSAAPHQPRALIQWAESTREMLASAFR